MDRIRKSLEAITRAKFMPPALRSAAGLDMACPIGHGQTISQPLTVRMMLEWLDPQTGERVLDVGSGSGWTSALLSYLVGPKGEVHAVERIAELVSFGRANCQKLKIKNVFFHNSLNDTYGWPDGAPYDRILVSDSAGEPPQELIKQLRPGGKLVIPIKQNIEEITKTASEEVERTVHPGFIFVPLIKN